MIPIHPASNRKNYGDGRQSRVVVETAFHRNRVQVLWIQHATFWCPKKSYHVPPTLIETNITDIGNVGTSPVTPGARYELPPGDVRCGRLGVVPYGCSCYTWCNLRFRVIVLYLPNLRTRSVWGFWFFWFAIIRDRLTWKMKTKTNVE